MLLILVHCEIEYQGDYVSGLLFIAISIYSVRRDLLADTMTDLSIPIAACSTGMRSDPSILDAMDVLKEPHYRAVLKP